WRQSPSNNNGGRRSDAHNNERSAGWLKHSKLPHRCLSLAALLAVSSPAAHHSAACSYLRGWLPIAVGAPPSPHLPA
ncbi:unnamed protein product, partial [Lampetra fluviatilis]